MDADEQATWQVVRWDDLVAEVGSTLSAAHDGPGPAVLAVDGRSASGKSTLAERLVASLPGAALVHSDDLAWYDSVVDWDRLLREGVLAPLHRGEAVDYRPPAWQERGRDGSITVPAGADPLVLEGVGVGRLSLADDVTLVLWVETSEPERWRREEHRIATGRSTRELVDSWGAEEDAHLRRDAPWSRARWVVRGDRSTGLADDEVLVLR